MKAESVIIGTWRFDPAVGELSRDGERLRLEDRTARTLALLARRRGEVVSQAEIIAEVWNGRSQSGNSVAIVISDLRKALGDDGRAQTCIETVTKRGYRLRPAEAGFALPASPPSPLRPPWLVPVAAVMVLAVLTLAAGWALWPTRPTARIEGVTNATGDHRYDALSRAVESVVISDVQAKGRLVLLAPGSARRPDLVIRGRLILWSGHPAVELTALDSDKGVTAWAALAPGPEDALPGQIEHDLESLRGRD